MYEFFAKINEAASKRKEEAENKLKRVQAATAQEEHKLHEVKDLTKQQAEYQKVFSQKLSQYAKEGNQEKTKQLIEEARAKNKEFAEKLSKA